MGRVLTVRKRGTERLILPGGRREAGEDDLTALARELREELDVKMDTATFLGRFEADAANEPGFRVKSSVYRVGVSRKISAQAEIEELLWVDPARPPAAPIAPLLLERILPALRATRSAGPA